MLYFDTATHDPVTGTLTVTTVAPSRTSWSVTEYQDVPTRLVADLAAAAPHGGEFVRERVAPFYPARRARAGDWQVPVPPDPAWVAAAALSGAVRD